MSSALFDSVARIARHEASARPIAAIGEVVDVFDASGGPPPDHCVTVRLRETGLLLPRVPIAVGALGAAATPRAGELVVVVFADGDIHAPVVVGRLYHADLAPPQHGDGDIVLALPAGADEPSFRMRLRGEDPSVSLAFGSEVELTVGDSSIRVKAGEAEAVVESGGGGRIELKVGDATLTLTGRGDVQLKASGTLTLEASAVEIKGQASVTVSAPQVSVN